jgi:cytochrome P450
LIANCVLLFNGGTGATINALGNGVTELLSRDDQLNLYLSDPMAYTDTAVEEFLRFEAPLQLFERTVLEDVTLWDRSLAKGSKVGLLFGSANRDSEIFDDPNSFDISRTRNQHLTFSAGTHFCLGAPLARLEIQTALPMLFDKFPALRLSGDPVPQNTFVVRGYSRVPVTA